MDINQLKEEYIKVYREKEWAKVVFTTLVCGMAGGLYKKLIGSLVGLILGFLIGLYRFQKRVKEMETRFENENIAGQTNK